MNRYKFKAKRKDNGKWVYGDLLNLYDGRKYIVNNQFGACIDNKGNFINTEAPFTNEIIPETLCQCTGLQDRDGEDIFENDIVELNNVEFRVDYSYGAFEFSHDCDIDKNCDDADYINPIDYKVDECKIIRNKFDKEED